MELTGKRVMVTGGGGFLGGSIVRRLEQEKAEVSTVRRKDHDLVDRAATMRAFEEIRPDVVVHAAADVGGIGYNRLFPADIFHNNVAMTANILDASAAAGVEKLVIVGSACAYPGDAVDVLKEEDLLAGPLHESVECYGISKRLLYMGAKAYHQQHGLNSIFLVLTNLYGPEDKFDPTDSHVIAALVRKFVESTERGEPEVVCWGTGRPVREFLYVDDCAEAIVRAAKMYDELDPLNVGTGTGTTIKELAETLRDVSGFKGEVVWDTTKPDGAAYKVLDISRMRERLQWEPGTSLREGLQRTVEWFRRAGLAELASR